MTDAALAFPDCSELWSLREHALAAQHAAAALFKAEKWIWAYKALGRAERFYRNLSDAENPFAVAGNVFLGRRPSARIAPRRPLEQPSPEDLHASLTERLRAINKVNAERGVALATLRDLVEAHLDILRPELAAAILRVEARVNPAPTG